MRRTKVALVAAGAVLLWGFFVATAAAVTPAAGGRYLDEQRPFDADPGEPATVGALQVSGDRRSLVSAGFPVPAGDGGNFGVADGGSYVQLPVHCAGAPQNVVFALGAPARKKVRVTRRGAFDARVRYVEQDLSASAELIGRFRSRKLLRVEVVNGHFRERFVVMVHGHEREGPYHRCAIPKRRLTFDLRPMPRYGTCATAAGRTLRSVGGARVYTNRGYDEEGYGRFAYACLRGGRPIPLGSTPLWDDDWGAVGMFRLAPPYVSYVDSYDTAFSGSIESLVVVDLRGDGRVVRRLDPKSDKEDIAAFPYIDSTVMTARGSSAWIVSYLACASPSPCSEDSATSDRDVWISDAAGIRRVGVGPGIDITSLSLNGPSVTWLDNGEPRSAPIDGVP